MESNTRDNSVRCGKLAGLTVLLLITGTLVTAGAQNKTASQDQSSTPPASAGKSSQSSAPASTATKQGPKAKQKTFSSAEEAAKALYDAARNHDMDGMMIILGPDAKDIVMWTDDPSARQADTDVFVQKYGQMHRLVREPDAETTLYVGAENWPLPIPLVEKNGAWYFDADLGRTEILYRRIGENEMDTVETLRALVDAQNEYFSGNSESTAAHEYAQRLASEPGKHDGLYWPGSNGPDDCPIGPYVAQASYDRSDRKPLHGYFFRVLTEQGARAQGGARNYIVDGKMTGGFAFVAFPAEYRSSGVKTFLVNENRRVFEKDLGPMTVQLARAMKVYNPDSSWTRVPREQ
jgi:Protein of unknown function (DUF2950)